LAATPIPVAWHGRHDLGALHRSFSLLLLSAAPGFMVSLTSHQSTSIAGEGVELSSMSVRVCGIEKVDTCFLREPSTSGGKAGEAASQGAQRHAER